MLCALSPPAFFFFFFRNGVSLMFTSHRTALLKWLQYTSPRGTRTPRHEDDNKAREPPTQRHAQVTRAQRRNR